MNIFILAQYFTITLVLTITIGLFTLKPTTQEVSVETTSVNVMALMNNQEEMSLQNLHK